MTEVHLDNYSTLFPKIEEAIKEARFIALDTEFSALFIDEKQRPSLFDGAKERYGKLRHTVGVIKPLQVGLTTFKFIPDSGDYTAETFTFYVWPRPVLGLNHTLRFKSSSFQFLSHHKFDFNKLIYKGLPYLNRLEEAAIRKQITSEDLLSLESDFEHILEDTVKEISKWFYTADVGKELNLGMQENFHLNIEGVYGLQKHIRKRYQDELWTTMNLNRLIVRKVSKETYRELTKQGKSLEEEMVETALGFTRTYRILIESKKPLIGHNLFMDLLLLYNTFEADLPKNYENMKKVINKSFPTVFDTKMLSHEISRLLKKNQLWAHNTLSCLYEYFKDLQGRHIALNSPLITNRQTSDSDHFHDAGWDSYCTGYIFIRMAHFLAPNAQSKQSRTLTSTEHFAAVEAYKNKVNVIRCSLSYINLNGDDPESRRPPQLIAQSSGRNRLDVPMLTTLLSSCGYVEVKLHDARNAIIAVDNHGSARQILKKFSNHTDFKIRCYKTMEHSKFARGALWTGLLFSSGLFAYLVHKSIEK